MSGDHLLVMTTSPDAQTAERLAALLVDESLAACVNILPPMQSIYRWQGERQQGEEHQLLIKTCDDRYTEIENYIKKHHPYELPEILGLPIQRGLTEYLGWVTDTTR